MKQFIFSTLVTVGVFACISCERHEWENSEEGVKDGTKNLFQSEKKGHGDAHGADSHAKKDSHGDDHSGGGH